MNSAISHPDHMETLEIARSELDAQSGCTRMYTLRGYAYSGGGRRVTRVEVSLDEGATWQLSNVYVHVRLVVPRASTHPRYSEYPEDHYRAMAYTDDVYGTLDLTERDTSLCVADVHADGLN